MQMFFTGCEDTLAPFYCLENKIQIMVIENQPVFFLMKSQKMQKNKICESYEDTSVAC